MTQDKDYFKIFCRISKAFGTVAERSELLDLIVNSAMDTMEAKAACLYLAPEHKDQFVPMAQVGLSENYLHDKPIKSQKIVAALEKEGYQAYPDATSDPRLEHHDVKKAEGIASILAVPVRVKDRTIGVLTLYTATRRDFESAEIDFLRALADQGGIAIEKNRLYRTVQKNAMIFRELASSINSSLDLKIVLNNMTENICDALDMKGTLIRLLDEETDSLKLVASHGLSDEFLDIDATTTETMTRALKGETLVVSDAATDESIQFKDAMKKEGFISMIVTPISVREKVIGVMHLYSAVQREFPSDLMVMVEALAHQGGLAIQNASMYKELQKDNRNLKKDVLSYRFSSLLT